MSGSRLRLPLFVLLTLTVMAVGTVAVAMRGAQAATVLPATTPTPPPSTPNTSPFPPGAPTNLAATAVHSTSVTLSWTASVPGCCPVSGYDVFYNQAYNDIIWTASLGNVTTATITANIQPAQQYRFSVVAHDDLGHRSGSSNSVTVVTPATDTGPDTTPPSAPTNLTAGAVSASGVALTWSPATDNVGVTGYNVYRFDGLFASTLLATVTATAYTAALSTMPPNNFYVRARDAAGNLSAASNLVAVSTPSQPPPTCRVRYVNQAEWVGGFVAGITITNTGTADINGWTLVFTFGGDQKVNGSWGVSVAQSGATVTIRNLPWDALVRAGGGSVSVGIQGTWSVSNAPPVAFTLNGQACIAG